MLMKWSDSQVKELSQQLCPTTSDPPANHENSTALHPTKLRKLRSSQTILDKVSRDFRSILQIS